MFRIRRFYSILIAFVLIILITPFKVLSQQDTTNYQWPIAPVNVQHHIGGAFGEYRSTTVDGHYHNGTDVSAGAGTPVLAVMGGYVAVAYDDGGTGYNSYVRITSNINGKTKNITYYHTRPIVSVGQNVIKGQQISTIAIDHVHLTEYRLNGSLSNSHINALRPDGGLRPYVDTWKPHIRYVKFLLDNSDTQLSTDALGNKVDIIAHIQEVNGTTSAEQNNGTYEVGYKILSANSQTVVYNPPDNGLRYKYYNIPNNAYVNVNYYKKESSTSKMVYIVTNGTGASNVASTQVVKNNYWNCDQLPYGNYVVMVYTIDVRGNADTVYIPVKTKNLDLTPPSAPKIRYVKKDTVGEFSVAWDKSISSDLKGYRLYYSLDGENYQIRDNENILTENKLFNSYQYLQNKPLFLRLTAVDNASLTNESIQTDSYGIRMLNDGKKILIVDGYDSTSSGGWTKPFDDFVVSHALAFNMSFESCSNEEVIKDSVLLSNYDLVIWYVGDKSESNNTLSLNEQQKISSYLENGGNVFLSGSNIAEQFSKDSSETEINFLHNILKAKFISGNSDLHGIIGTSNYNFSSNGFLFGITGLGSPYNEYSSDVIDTIGGSLPILTYTDNKIAGIAYSGNFNNSANTGKIIYLSFPFETICKQEDRSRLMSDALIFFGLKNASDVKEQSENNLPGNFALNQNFPNPFNPSTIISYSIPVQSNVLIEIFDILGQKVKTLLNAQKQAGNYKIIFEANALPSGVYFYRLSASELNGNSGRFVSTKKMLVLK